MRDESGFAGGTRTLEILLIVVVGVMALVFGFVGFLTYAPPALASGPHRYGLFDAIWATTTLFDGGGIGGADLNHLNLLLRIARVLAPLVIVYAGIRAVFVVLGNRVRTAAVRGWRGHIVICGTGAREIDLALTLAPTERVVVIGEKVAGALALTFARVHVISGSPVDQHTLRLAGAERARLLMALGDDAALNAEIIERAAELCDSDERQRTHLVANIDDPALAEIIRASIGQSNGFNTTPIHLEALAADALVSVPTRDEDSSPHVLVLGDDRLAAEVVRAAARQWAIYRVDRLRQAHVDDPAEALFTQLPKLPVTLAGEDAVERAEVLLATHPALESVISLHAVEGFRANVPTGGVWEEIQSRAHVTRAFVTGHGVSAGIAAGLRLGTQLTEGDVVVAVPRPAPSLEAHVAAHSRASEDRADISLVAVDRETLTLEVLQSRDRIERMARALHEERLRATARHGAAHSVLPRAELSPLYPWHDLAPDQRALARRCAQRLLDALREDGWLVEDRDASQFGVEDLHTFAVPDEALQGVPPGRVSFILARSDLAALPESPAVTRQALQRAAREHDEQTIVNLLIHQADARAWHEIGLGDELGLSLVSELLDLWRLVLEAEKSRTPAPKAVPAVIVGGVGSLTREQMDEAETLLDRAMAGGRRGTLISGGTQDGVPGVVGRAASRHGWTTIGYLPAGMAGSDDYDELVATEGDTPSIREAFRYWRDLSQQGVQPQDVPVLAFPGGAITRQEVLLAASLGASVGLISLAGSGWEQQRSPRGRIVKLPPDSATIAAFLDPPRPCRDVELRERVARAVHDLYRDEHAFARPADDPAMAPWNRLAGSLKDSSLARADALLQTLGELGFEPHNARDGGHPFAFPSGTELEALAEREHGRWNVERLLAGWRPGLRNPERKRTPYLVPYSELPPEVADFDRHAVRAVPNVLRLAGVGVREADPERSGQPDIGVRPAAAG